MLNDKQRVDRARRDLRRIGLRLNKRGVGFQIVDERNTVIEGKSKREYEMTLDDVEAYLEKITGPAETRLLAMSVPLGDDEILDRFFEAIDNFPVQHQKAAIEWLAVREAAYVVLKGIETKGLSALLPD